VPGRESEEKGAHESEGLGVFFGGEATNEKVENGEGEDTKEEGGEADSVFGEAEDGDERDDEVNIDGGFEIDEGAEDDGERHAKFVFASFENGVGVVALGGFVEIKAGGGKP